MLHGVQVSLHSAYAVLSHGPRPLYSLCGHHTGGAVACYTGDLSRLEDGRQQAADCIPCTPLVERWRPALLLLDGSGAVSSLTRYSQSSTARTADGTVQGLFEPAGVPVIGCGHCPAPCAWTRTGPASWRSGRRHPPEPGVFHSSDDFSRIASAAEELGYRCLSNGPGRFLLQYHQSLRAGRAAPPPWRSIPPRQRRDPRGDDPRL